jgi:hypothetical protein
MAKSGNLRRSFQTPVFRAVLVLLCHLALGAPAHAADDEAMAEPLDARFIASNASVGLEEQPQFVEDAMRLMREAQDNVLRPCVRNIHNECRRQTTDLLARLKAQGATVASWAPFGPIRNNMYFYLVAPSLRLARAILKSGDGCGEWESMAAASGTSLPRLFADATVELSGQKTQSNLPESDELSELQLLFGAARCRAVGADG